MLNLSLRSVLPRWTGCLASTPPKIQEEKNFGFPWTDPLEETEKPKIIVTEEFGIIGVVRADDFNAEFKRYIPAIEQHIEEQRPTNSSPLLLEMRIPVKKTMIFTREIPQGFPARWRTGSLKDLQRIEREAAVYYRSDANPRPFVPFAPIPFAHGGPWSVEEQMGYFEPISFQEAYEMVLGESRQAVPA